MAAAITRTRVPVDVRTSKYLAEFSYHVTLHSKTILAAARKKADQSTFYPH